MAVVHVLSATMTATAAPDIEDLYDLLQEQTAAERTNVSAQIALFSALVGLAPVAIVFGVLGMYEADRRPNETGSWIAFAATILGFLELVVVIIIAILMTR